MELSHSSGRSKPSLSGVCVCVCVRGGGGGGGGRLVHLDRSSHDYQLHSDRDEHTSTMYVEYLEKSVRRWDTNQTILHPHKVSHTH